MKNNITGLTKDDVNQKFMEENIDNIVTTKAFLVKKATGERTSGTYYGSEVTIKRERYVGQINASKQRHGYGKMEYANGDTYMGEWKLDKKDGEGVLEENKKKYTGIFKEGELVDTKMIEFENGDKYIGECSNYKTAHGMGTYFYTNGEKYVGKMTFNTVTGKGIMYKSTGTIYEGDFVDSLPYKKITIKYVNGDIYQGEVSGFKREGLGRIDYSDGSFFEGMFHADEKVSVENKSVVGGLND